MATEQQPLKRSKNGSRTRDANGSWQPSEQAGPRSIPEPGMLIPQESHESGTLQSTLQPLGHEDRAVGGVGQQAVTLQRPTLSLLRARNRGYYVGSPRNALRAARNRPITCALCARST